MKVSKIVHLESYRSRKDIRLRRALALHSHDRRREQVLVQLWRAITRVGADRGAILWLDEYGPGLVHAHSLLDLASDRPRRLFSPIPLRGAWDAGVPGLVDLSDAARGGLGRHGEGIRSVCAIALGSDGPRSWYLYLDSVTPRTPLSQRVIGDLMFIAGECASLLLHRDLDRESSAGMGKTGRAAMGGEGEEPFAGWPVLQDIEGRRDDASASAIIATRFLVARVVRGLLDDDLVVDPDSLGYQVNGIRTELEAFQGHTPERKMWERVLASVELLDQDELLAAVLEWGGLVEAAGHLRGALEIHTLAYELAVAAGAALQAVEAARFRGRVHRKLADWDEAVRWYGVAKGVAEEVESPGKLAVVLDGLANTYRDRGNLPKARELLGKVLELGRTEENRHAEAVGHHDLMTVEKLAGELGRAIVHGWNAVQRYESREGSLQALFDLAGVLKERGDLSAAWDAYTVVAAQLTVKDYRILSVDAMAHIAAMRGDSKRYQSLRLQVDGMGWEDSSSMVRGQVLLYRGISLQALGRRVEAREWLNRALAFAERHELNKLIFDTEAALERGEELQAPAHLGSAEEMGDPESRKIREVHQGLRTMRETLVGASEPL